MRAAFATIAIANKYTDEAYKELYEIATEIKSLSQALCPVDQGTLRGSAYIEERREQGKIIIGYGGAAASYALKQHENLHYHHTVGQAKFLEQAFLEITAKIKE